VRIRASLVALLAAGTLSTLLFGSATVLEDIRSSRPWVAHAREVQRALSNVRGALVDAEAAQRGFLLAGDRDSLEPLENAEASLPATIGDLKRLVAEDEEPARRGSAELERLASDKMAEIHRTIDLHERGQIAAALDLIRGDASKAIMRNARRLISEMREREDKRLEGRTAALRANFDRAMWIEAGAGIGVLVLGFVLFAIHRDIARREVLENALREEAGFQQRFIGILGHDLRNPLGAISMTAGQLRRSLSPPHSEMVKRLEHSAARMGRMIEQLLDVTRARLGDGIPIDAKVGIDLSEVVASAVDELCALHPDAVVRVHVDRVHGHWDPDRLGQVVSNLVANAIRHGEGAVNVRVRTAEASAILEVQNGGNPIPAEVLPRIFEPFRRAPNGGENGSSGLGLGLFIAERIVAAHGGTIDVRSTRAMGTTFTVALPVNAN
jgi:signal transduction histidine kinase